MQYNKFFTSYGTFIFFFFFFFFFRKKTLGCPAAWLVPNPISQGDWLAVKRCVCVCVCVCVCIVCLSEVSSKLLNLLSLFYFSSSYPLFHFKKSPSFLPPTILFQDSSRKTPPPPPPPPKKKNSAQVFILAVFENISGRERREGGTFALPP